MTRPGLHKVGLIVQARMGSARLPGKSMMDLAGAPLLARILERVKRCRLVDTIIVATTQKPEDEVLMKLAQSQGVAAYQGSETDLVDRYYRAAKAFGSDVVVRFPGDNPVPEPEEIDRIIAYHLEATADFSSNLAQVYGNGYPDGIGAEVFNLTCLEAAWADPADSDRREHVHLNFFDYKQQRPTAPDRFTVGTIECPAAFRRPDLVLDVNTLEQYRFMSELYGYLYPRNPAFHITDIIEWHDHVYCGVKS